MTGPGQFLKVAIHCALSAGALLKQNLTQTHEFKYKGVTDLVTEMDHCSEKVIIDALIREFPDHSILSEERGRIGPGKQEYLWHIDPLDGTTNYAHGLPWYTVSIGLEFRQQIIVGVVYQPELEELFVAQQGQGAFLNNHEISVSRETQLGQSLLATGFPYDIQEKKITNITQFSTILLQCQGIRRAGSAALDLCYVACGRFDGFWEFGLSSWDTAAGSLILTEAGGRCSTVEGKSYTPYQPSIVASNQHIHEALRYYLDDNLKERHRERRD